MLHRTRQEKTFDVPMMTVAQLSDSVKTKEKERLTLESEKAIDLSDETDSLTVRSNDKRQLPHSADKVVRRKDTVREMVMKSLLIRKFLWQVFKWKILPD